MIHYQMYWLHLVVSILANCCINFLVLNSNCTMNLLQIDQNHRNCIDLILHCSTPGGPPVVAVAADRGAPRQHLLHSPVRFVMSHTQTRFPTNLLIFVVLVVVVVVDLVMVWVVLAIVCNTFGAQIARI